MIAKDHRKHANAPQLIAHICMQGVMNLQETHTLVRLLRGSHLPL